MNTNQKDPRFLRVSWVLLQKSNISSTNKLLYSVIAHDCEDNQICSRTLKDLSDIVGVVPLAVTNALRKLEQDGYISIIEGKSQKNRPQYSYKITKGTNDD